MSYQSPIPYERSRIHAAAVYCSDGRVGAQFDDFLQNSLELPRYDRVALPGGPACLASHPETQSEQMGVIDELRFLVEVHELNRIILIQHQGCAFYGSRLGLEASRLELVQRADLIRSAAFVQRVTGLSTVEGYYAALKDGKLIFEPVKVNE